MIVKSGNMSLGVNLLAALVRQAAKALDADFDIEILEMHHRHKVDAPSGTALLLGKAAADGRGIDLAARSVRGRDGHTGPRKRGDIGFATLRGGSVVGDHSVIFAGEGEIDRALAHAPTDRAIFARGAIKAALWGRGKQARPLFDGRRARPNQRIDRSWTVFSCSSATARANGTSRTCSPAGAMST